MGRNFLKGICRAINVKNINHCGMFVKVVE
jgi:hypothetical protein